MAYSTDVSQGDTATATQYNNLRADILSNGHHHNGDSNYVGLGVTQPVSTSTNHLLQSADTERTKDFNTLPPFYSVAKSFSVNFKGAVAVRFLYKTSGGNQEVMSWRIAVNGVTFTETHFENTTYVEYIGAVSGLVFGDIITVEFVSTQMVIHSIKECRLYIGCHPSGTVVTD